MKSSRILSSEAHIQVNKFVARTVGLYGAIILAELIRWQEHWEGLGRLDEEGMFYCPIETLEEGTTLSRKQQTPAINVLVEMGLIETRVKTVPAKRHFKVNDEAVLALVLGDRQNKFVPNGQTGEAETDKLDSPKVPTIKKELKEIKKKEIDIKIEYAESVTMTEKQHNTLIEKYGPEKTNGLIELLSNSKLANGYEYESDYHAMYTWVLKEYDKREVLTRPARSNQKNSGTSGKPKIDGIKQGDVSAPKTSAEEVQEYIRQQAEREERWKQRGPQ